MNWQTRSDELVKLGFPRGRPWESQLKTHLEGNFPQLVKELGKSLPAYLHTRASEASEMYETLTEQGTPPEVARELALKDLLPEPAELREHGDLDE